MVRPGVRARQIKVDVQVEHSNDTLIYNRRTKTTARTSIIAAAAAVLAAGPVHGQEKAGRQWYEPETGRVRTGSVWLTIETVDQALHGGMW